MHRQIGRVTPNAPAMFIVESYRPEVDHDHSTSLFSSLLFDTFTRKALIGNTIR
jgi:hypothetical protein